jgi:bifunctional DNA-binding transcriptional regulator/antitoxin component of YhaV-PrlF toxin-antitoxin module
MGTMEDMSTLKKLKTVELDERGRITLPKDLRRGVGSFAIESLKDGSLHLVPQKKVTMEEAEILESLKKSVSEFKKGQTKKVPTDWMD